MADDKIIADIWPLDITFVAGEQPTHTKFNSLVLQIESALELLAMSIGDAWGNVQGGDLNAGGRPNTIASLARLIGPASILNPVYQANNTGYTYSPTITIPGGVNEFNLRACNVDIPFAYADYPTDVSLVIDLSIESALEAIDGADNIFAHGQRQTVRSDVDSPGDYMVDLDGTVYCYTKTGSSGYTGTLTNLKTVGPSDSYFGATWNVIPDFNETAANKFCIIASVSGTTYKVTLPMITTLPLDSTGVGDISTVPPVTFQALLPSVISSLADNAIIPEGFMYLWDNTTEAIVSGVTFRTATTPDDKSITVVASGITLDVSNGGNDRYRLVTVGTTITETLAALRRTMFVHDHKQNGYGLPIEHTDLLNNHIHPSVVSSKWSKTVDSPISTIVGNDHPQYLLKYGWTGAGVDGGQYDNALLGDLFFASTNFDTDYSKASINSFGLKFAADADVANAAYLYYNTTQGKLQLDGKGLYINGGDLAFAAANNIKKGSTLILQTTAADGAIDLSTHGTGGIYLKPGTSTTMLLLQTTGLTAYGKLTITTGGLDLDNGGITDCGSILGVGANITAAAALQIGTTSSGILALTAGASDIDCASSVDIANGKSLKVDSITTSGTSAGTDISFNSKNLTTVGTIGCGNVTTTGSFLSNTAGAHGTVGTGTNYFTDMYATTFHGTLDGASSSCSGAALSASTAGSTTTVTSGGSVTTGTISGTGLTLTTNSFTVNTYLTGFYNYWSGSGPIWEKASEGISSQAYDYQQYATAPGVYHYAKLAGVWDVSAWTGYGQHYVPGIYLEWGDHSGGASATGYMVMTDSGTFEFLSYGIRLLPMDYPTVSPAPARQGTIICDVNTGVLLVYNGSLWKTIQYV